MEDIKDRRGWRAYTVDDVVQLALFREASKDGGYGLEAVQYFVGNAYLKLFDVAKPIDPKKPADCIFIAMMVHAGNSKSTFAGTLKDLGRYAEDNDKRALHDVLLHSDYTSFGRSTFPLNLTFLSALQKICPIF